MRPHSGPGRLSTAALLGVLALGAAACTSTPDDEAGSSADNTSAIDPGDPSTDQAQTPEPEPSEDAPTGDLTSAGEVRITSQDKATSIVASFEVGQPSEGADGAPSDEVLDACNANYTTTIAQSAFIPAAISFHYVKGTLPIQVTFVPRESVHPDAVLAVQVDGQWRCDAVNFTLDPDESGNLPAYVLYQGLSNAHPSLTDADTDSLAFQTQGTVSVDGGYIQAYQATGPGAFCSKQAPGEIFMFATEGQCPSGF